jgi:hypothetical protein
MGRATPCVVVIAGPDPAIHRAKRVFEVMDARVKPAHDDVLIGDEP